MTETQQATNPPVAAAQNADSLLDQVLTQTMKAPATATDFIMNPVAMAQIEAIAGYMCDGKTTVPAHLQKNKGDCMAVCLQAMTWGMNPWGVAQKTHLIHGRLGYEAQLVNAVIIARAPIVNRPNYEWFGDWGKILGKIQVKDSKKTDDNGDAKKYASAGWNAADEIGLGIRVSCTLRGETEPRVLELYMVQAFPRNSTLWATDPKQQLAYLALKRWAALHTPDVILGVYTPEELEAMGKEKEIPTEPPKAKTGKNKSDDKATDFNPDEIIAIETVRMLEQRINHRGINLAQFLEKFNVEDIGKLTKGQMNDVNQWFKEMGKK